MLVAHIVLMMRDDFKVERDDGPVIGFVLVVAAGLSFDLSGMCVIAGVETSSEGHDGPVRACFLDRGFSGQIGL